MNYENDKKFSDWNSNIIVNNISRCADYFINRQIPSFRLGTNDYSFIGYGIYDWIFDNMTEPKPVYKTLQHNPFDPYLTDGDIVYIKSELDELLSRDGTGAIVLVWINGELKEVITTARRNKR